MAQTRFLMKTYIYSSVYNNKIFIHQWPWPLSREADAEIPLLLLAEMLAAAEAEKAVSWSNLPGQETKIQRRGKH